jgi:hypothetical protein
MVTFEEYKKQFEIFCKIDSPEKLAICESQYKSHLLFIQAQKHFEPFEYKSGDDVLSTYEKNLFSLLPFDKIIENQLSLLIRPSFEPESLLIIDKKQDRYFLTYTTLVTNYWHLLYKNAGITDVEKRVVNAELKNGIGDKLYALIDTAILEARKPVGGGFVLDGVVYTFSRILNDKQISVFKHSPDEDSKTGRIINVMQYLIDNIPNLDAAAQSTLENLLETACYNELN